MVSPVARYRSATRKRNFAGIAFRKRVFFFEIMGEILPSRYSKSAYDIRVNFSNSTGSAIISA